MRKILSIMFLVLLGFAVCAEPKRAVLGSKGVDAEEQSLTASDYIQDGLVAIWDGIENAGWGVNDKNANLWTDLIYGSTLSRWSGAATWGDNCLIKPATNEQVWDNAENASDIITALNDAAGFSVEYCCERTGANSGYEWMFYTRSFLIQVQGDQTLIYYINNQANIVSRGGKWVSGAHTAALTSIKSDGAKAFLDGSPVGGVQTPVTVATTALSFRNTGKERKIYCIRLYNRALSDNEVYHNALVDKLRFDME